MSDEPRGHETRSLAEVHRSVPIPTSGSWIRRMFAFAGPAYLVQHEHNGLVTYDNPGSMVWALDRLLHDPHHAEMMGRNGKRAEGAAAVDWTGVVRLYLDLCAAAFPELRGAD